MAESDALLGLAIDPPQHRVDIDEAHVLGPGQQPPRVRPTKPASAALPVSWRRWTPVIQRARR
jgi:hypothetical protein